MLKKIKYLRKKYEQLTLTLCNQNIFVYLKYLYPNCVSIYPLPLNKKKYTCTNKSRKFKFSKTYLLKEWKRGLIIHYKNKPVIMKWIRKTCCLAAEIDRKGNEVKRSENGIYKY